MNARKHHGRPLSLHQMLPILNPLSVKKRKIVTCTMKKSTQDKYRKLFKLLLLTAIPTCIVIAQSIISLEQNFELLRDNQVVKEDIKQSIQIGTVIHQIQIERGTASLYVSSKGDKFVKQRLVSFYNDTDTAISSLSKWTYVLKFSNRHCSSQSQLREYMSHFRQSLNPNKTTIKDVITFYTDITTQFIAIMKGIVNMKKTFSFWSEVVAYELIISSKEELGIERALGSTYFSRGKLPVEDLWWYNNKFVLGIRLQNEGLRFSSCAKILLDSSMEDSFLVDSIMGMRQVIKNNSLTSPSVKSGTSWFDNMTTYINILNFVQESLASTIMQSADEDVFYFRNQLIASGVQLCVAVIMLPVVLVLVGNIVNISSKLKERTFDLEVEKHQTEALLTELEEERKRTEDLLYQLLPKSVAKTLMENGTVDPESFDSVTIMFSDVVGFTTIASSSTPMEVVYMLNNLYKTMDGHVEQVDAYKVETIGDAYMVTSGLPKRNGEKHVAEIAKLAIALLSDKMSIPHKENEVIQLRIGFNTGPCVAGVVGTRMPRYCIFGDTVNTASRMESTSLPHRIQMTESSALKLQETGRFVISKRGNVQVKGKGVMLTYWLEGMGST